MTFKRISEVYGRDSEAYKLLEAAEEAINSNQYNWIQKYNYVFDEIAPKITELGEAPDWYSDSTYEEDVRTYVYALREHLGC